METNSGISTRDSQKAICDGTYGGREWSEEEKQSACQRYNELENTNVTAGTITSPTVLLGSVFLIVIIVLVVMLIKKHHSHR